MTTRGPTCRLCHGNLRIEHSSGLYFVGCTCITKWFGASRMYEALDLWESSCSRVLASY